LLIDLTDSQDVEGVGYPCKSGLRGCLSRGTVHVE
jgi:hypothetical protein